MIEIVSVSGRSIFVAKDATSVAAAMREAHSVGANLREANLREANLREANLREANLREANLGGADLRGADLYGANLGGADLRGADLYGADLYGANLGGADLRGADLYGADLYGANLYGADLYGANLGGADLRGADLYGADLYGANLGGAVWIEVVSTLEKSLKSMNDNGRHWIKGTAHRLLSDGSHAYCSIGAIENASEGTVRAVSEWLLTSVCAGSIPAFNDYSETTWEDICSVFAVAILHAKRFAAQQG